MNYDRKKFYNTGPWAALSGLIYSRLPSQKMFLRTKELDTDILELLGIN
jgi:hypothetical protein